MVLRKETLSLAKHLLCNLLGHLAETSVDTMKKAIWELLVEFNPNVVEFADLRSTYIANCVFINFLSYTAIMLNIVTIHAIRKISSLPKTLHQDLCSSATPQESDSDPASTSKKEQRVGRWQILLAL